MVDNEQKIKVWLAPLSTCGLFPRVLRSPTPHCRFINLELIPGSNLFVDGFKATVLPENPTRQSLLSYQQLQLKVATLLKMYVCHQLYLYKEAVGGGLRMVPATMELEAYAGKTLSDSEVCLQELDEPRCRAVKLPPPNTNPHCQFHDVTTDSGGCGTVLLENRELTFTNMKIITAKLLTVKFFYMHM